MDIITEARREAIAAAQRAIARPLVVFDTETTGLGRQAQVIEIAALDLDGNILLDTLVKPTVPVPTDATEIHGIKDEDLADAPTVSDIWPEIELIFRGGAPGSYNLAFDRRILNQSLQANGHDPLALDGLCVMTLFAEFYGEYNDYHRSFTWQSLTNAARFSGVNVDGPAHRALSDAQMALGVLKHIARG